MRLNFRSVLTDCPQGVSVVKALATAAAQGQKIYTITRQIYQNNPGIVSGNLYSLSANTRRDIQNALDAGYEVTVHEAPITLSGWTGAGYTFIDPETGAGGYIIDGGSNGAWLEIISAALSGFVDAMVTKLRNPNAVNGPINELMNSRYINFLSKATTALTFIKSIYDISTDDKLTPTKQFFQILFTTAFTIAAMVGAGAIGLFFAVPIVGAFFGLLLAVALAYLLIDLKTAIAEF